MPNTEQDINRLFEQLRDACEAQFGFVPNRVSDNVEYMGRLRNRKHRFRDTLSKSEIHMRVSGEKVTVELHERLIHPDGDWTDEIIQAYKVSDEAVQAELDQAERSKHFAAQSALWLMHGDYLKSLYRDHPTYQDGGPTPMKGVEDLLSNPEVQQSDAYLEFSTHYNGQNLARHLLSAYEFERKEAVAQLVKVNPHYPELLEAVKAMTLNKGSDAFDEDLFDNAVDVAIRIIDMIPRYLHTNSHKMQAVAVVLGVRDSLK